MHHDGTGGYRTAEAVVGTANMPNTVIRNGTVVTARDTTWAFTEIDQTASAGLRIRANMIKRSDDNFGLACVVNGLSDAHRNYLNAGGYGFMLGDGKLSNYGYEQILETFYRIRLSQYLWATIDYQLILNPGYNKSRGPVNVFAIRGHVEF